MLEEVPWKLEEDLKKEGIVLHSVTSSRGNNLMKAVGVVDFPLSACIEILTDSAYDSKLDPEVELTEAITTEVAANTDYFYQKTKAFAMFEPRDVVYAAHITQVRNTPLLLTYLCL